MTGYNKLLENLLISNVTAHMLMLDYLYGHTIPISSELDRFQNGSNHPKGEDKSIPKGDPSILGWQDKSNRLEKQARRETNKITGGLSPCS